MQWGWMTQVINTGTLVTPYGLKFHWPKSQTRRDGTHANRTEIYNYGVQGLATGEIIPIALVYFWYRTRDIDITIVNTIHDSIICEFPKELTEKFHELAVQCMTHDVFYFLKRVYKYELNVTLGTGVKVSSHWGDTKEETQYNVTPSGEMKTKVKS